MMISFSFNTSIWVFDFSKLVGVFGKFAIENFAFLLIFNSKARQEFYNLLKLLIYNLLELPRQQFGVAVIDF